MLEPFAICTVTTKPHFVPDGEKSSIQSPDHFLKEGATPQDEMKTDYTCSAGIWTQYRFQGRATGVTTQVYGGDQSPP